MIKSDPFSEQIVKFQNKDSIFHRTTKERRQEIRRLRVYGLTQAEFDILLEKQDYKCGICRKPFDSSAPHVDHAHDASRKVRGLLCCRCNTILGGYENALKIIKRIRKYLRNDYAQ